MKNTAEGLQLIEPSPVDDDLCSGGLVLIEDLGFGARFVVCNEQTCYEAGGPVLVVKRKIVLPMHRIRPGVEMALGFLTRRAVTAAGEGILRLVR